MLNDSVTNRSDCTPGICWGGTCAGNTHYSIDGKCGPQHGDRLCAGKWGDCCNLNGQCGSGNDFCNIDSCYSGECDWPVVITLRPSSLGLVGNTTDGTCGAASTFTCDSGHGNCCNKNNVCGSLPSDCGIEYGWYVLSLSSLRIYFKH